MTQEPGCGVLQEARGGPRGGLDVGPLYGTTAPGAASHQCSENLAWTCFRHPELLPEAVKFTIYGHHFRKVCELHVPMSGDLTKVRR